METKSKSRKLNHKASTATCFYSRPSHTQPLQLMVVLCSHWDTYFLFCKSPRQSTSPGCSKGSASSAQLRKHCLADFKCFPYYPNWCAWLENTSGKKLWTDTSPRFTCVTRLKCHHVVFRVLIDWNLLPKKVDLLIKGIKMASYHWSLPLLPLTPLLFERHSLKKVV